jgi:hypothetical protein
MNHPLPEITQIRHRIGVLTANKLSRFDVLWLCIIALVFQLATFNLNAQQPAFLTNGLVAYYPFNGNANDESGNGRNPISQVGVAYTSNSFGQPKSAATLTSDSQITVPDFPEAQLHLLDFFTLNRQYDLVIEQTFFCALDPDLRQSYVEKMHEILVPGGKLVGVLFDEPMNSERPPFGGHSKEYMTMFSSFFREVNIAPCYNSIQPRAGREVFVKLKK